MALEINMPLLEWTDTFNKTAIRGLLALLGSIDLRALARDYQANLAKRNVDIGLNLFAIISPHYYRETFHSDVLYALIDPSGKQGQQKYLQTLLEFIRSQGAAVGLENYTDAKVLKEQGRVDLLVCDDSSKRAIIIENKINNAGDQPRQLPRYLGYVENTLGYKCDAIVYLRLNRKAGPDTTGWTTEEQRNIAAILQGVCAYDETANDLLNGWIRPCERIATDPDAQHILRQYGELITKLGGHVMNKPIMDQFYLKMVEGENLRTAMSLKAMVEDLILYRVEKIIDTFQNDLAPFTRIGNWKDVDAYFTNPVWLEPHLGIDIGVEPESYSFLFWDRNDRPGVKGFARAALEEMGCLGDYQPTDLGFGKTFAFPSEEEALYSHVRNFKMELSRVMARRARK